MQIGDKLTALKTATLRSAKKEFPLDKNLRKKKKKKLIFFNLI